MPKRTGPAEYISTDTPLDGLFIQVTNVPAEEPISGIYVVDPDGTINLGPSYGPPIRVIGMSLERVKDAVEEQLKKVKILNPKAAVALGQSRALQQIRGEHLVRPDGTVGLGTPEISVDVASYNSKVFFVIYDGAGNGQQVLQLPVTGNDTVLRAIATLNGLPPLSSRNRIWIARPSPVEAGRELIMPVDWMAIVTKGQTKTNYQMLPGDRLYINGNRLIATNTFIAQMLAPLERLLGFTLLGNATGRAVDGQQQGGGGF
ncbi:MAG: polysaccharide biosynthesis/export family protein [Planctomycetes bacterium]|nr:polysaccharide biosynthesis/export family protein [Planctomycetota bacterium]